MKYATNKILLLAVMVTLLTTTSTVFAQNNSAAAPQPALPQALGVLPAAPIDPTADWVTKFFELKNADANEMKSILSIFRANILVPTIPTGGTGKYRIISVRAPKEIMTAIEDTIARFDVPPPPQPARAPEKSIEVSVQVLGAYDAAPPNCGTCAIPQSLQPVITQLQKNFSYKTYLLLDTQLYRQTVRASLNSVNSLPGMNDNSATYSIFWNSAAVWPDQSIHLSSLKFGAEVWMTGRGSSTHFGFETQEVQIPADQQIVIGKTTVGNSTIILVIRAKVMD